MNQTSLKRAAEEFVRMSESYSSKDAEVKGLRDAFSDLLQSIMAGNVREPLDWRDIPGAWQFNEGELRKYADLEEAYARLKIELTGGESPVLRSLRADMTSKI